ncbi:HepA Superfamily II DNA/RNA helicases, SNF2 family [uncultured Caudovirales phage]|uniref:HepA Superfamily II DNA/RNA helicases, SNF2 family n=1 Tax=uncultured Caudovirales phage TaxID=2100421 RepID=A0A6J5QJG1_9CAUD|nr:HepA Superfamily II DNA/RNA helicases, SNF2 family [uncultured Caudovirales phage]
MNNIIPQNLPVIPQKYKPFAHQQEALELSWNAPHFALLMEMGCGKSKVAVDTIAALAVLKEINGVLVLAPKGVYLNWVKEEFPRHMPDMIDYFMAPWRSLMNKDEEKKFKLLLKHPEPGVLDIMVMNIEGINVERGFRDVIKFLETHNVLTIIDESTCIKSHKADRSKRAWTIGKLSKYRRIMTGTPITQDPLDLFSQFQFLQPGCLKFTSYSAFRAFYANMGVQIMGNRSFPKILGFRNLETLQRDLQPISYRKLKTECLDLPPKVYQTRYIDMEPEQRTIYEKFKKEALLTLNEQTITSTSALTTIMKLQQIACGFVVDDDSNEISIPTNRLDALGEIVQDIQGKVIVWCAFRRNVEDVVAYLKETYGDHSTVHYYGGTTDDGRAESLERFKNDPTCRFFIGTAATGGMGITLIQSNTTVYFSNGYNLMYRLQSEDRNHRIGQQNTVNVIDIVCNNTVDERIVKILKAKKDLASMVLDNWKELILGLTEDL